MSGVDFAYCPTHLIRSGKQRSFGAHALLMLVIRQAARFHDVGHEGAYHGCFAKRPEAGWSRACGHHRNAVLQWKNELISVGLITEDPDECYLADVSGNFDPPSHIWKVHEDLTLHSVLLLDRQGLTFTRVPLVYWNHKAFSLRARRLWVVLHSYKNMKTGLAYPARKTLAGDMGCSVETVKRAVQELVKLRLIEVRQNRSVGIWSSNHYLIPANLCTPDDPR